MYSGGEEEESVGRVREEGEEVWRHQPKAGGLPSEHGKGA